MVGTAVVGASVSVGGGSVGGVLASTIAALRTVSAPAVAIAAKILMRRIVPPFVREGAEHSPVPRPPVPREGSWVSPASPMASAVSDEVLFCAWLTVRVALLSAVAARS